MMRAVTLLVTLAAGCVVGEVPTGGGGGGGDVPDGRGADASGDGGGGGAASLQITATSSPTAGAVFSPNHCVAVWIEGPGGAFVKTVQRWADIRKQHLVAWTVKAGATDADAVSGATRNSHATPLNIVWDLKGKAGTVVPDGTYTVRMEVTDLNATTAGQNNQGTFTFVKGTAPQSQTALSNGGFSNVTLVFTPL